MKLLSSVYLLVSFVVSSMVLTSWAETMEEQTPLWIDVRTEKEYRAEHVPDAIHIPYQEITEGIKAVTQDKSAPIYLYCGSGRRAGKAKKALEADGFTLVTNIGGLKQALQKKSSDSNSEKNK